jgi:outer membrane receptor protein involved in Fe transport
MSIMGSKRHALLLCGAASIALATAGFANAAEAANFDIAPQPLSTALAQFGVQSEQGVFADSALTGAKLTKGVRGDKPTEVALNELLAGTGLGWKREGQAFVIVRAADPQSGSAAGGGAEVEALIVTAQKREEDIQDVPIAISAFSQEDLTRSQVAGGPDLITQVPNMTFTKTNFSSYSIQLRGIGTQAISATTDPAVAVAFNNTPFIRNRFFEQEFYDLQRVEVLRGPQGTLYGRNATAGVVNIISAKPKFLAEAKLSGDLGNFSSSRVEGMINIPLVADKVALRLAGAWTKRDGYSTNELTGNPIDGRDLWSSRLSLRVAPTDALDINLIWEHFEEDDDRLRSGKQLCKKDVLTEVAGFPATDMTTLPDMGQSGTGLGTAGANFSQGCTRVSLYSPESFQTPNGLMLPYYVPLDAVGLPAALLDPYASRVQSQDLRVIESAIDPTYRAESDIGELQISLDITDHLTLSSETAYAVDGVYSLQDFNRFNTAPGAWEQPRPAFRPGLLQQGPNGGIFCDPQLGCSDRLVAVDISTAEARQFSQEFRLGSDFDGPFNFSLGANYLRADSEDKYYVFFNSISMVAADSLFGNYATPYQAGVTDNVECLLNGYERGDPRDVYSVVSCTYMDPNPIESVNDEGHNYFLSKNPYKLISYAVFGEAYYQVTDALKVTAGLRWTVDKKDAPRILTWILNSHSVGYPVLEVIEQEWREPTGRLTVDWKPDFSFTDETLLYASYAHGYKAGGANPPGFVRSFYADKDTAILSGENSETRPKTFDPEFVDAFELGAKNTLLDGRVTANLAAFYYDYKNYQISEIVDRSAFNRNFDATVWGVELESDWRPLENLRFGLKIGYEETAIADHEWAIDLMDRTAGDPAWTLMRPFPTYASSCIIPTWLTVGNAVGTPANPELVIPGGASGGNPTACEWAYTIGYDPISRAPYESNPATSHPFVGTINYAAWSTDPAMFPGWPTDVPLGSSPYPGWDPLTAPNGGEGILKPLGGNELPNAPNLTATITADYTIPLPNEWLATLHTDLHWQGDSAWRVFQDHEFSRLDEYFTMNLAAIFTNEERGWNIMAYIKNVTDETALTGAFLNSDDTGLTANVFLTEPRLYGLRVTKAWTGGPLLGGFGANREGPFPLTVEIGGQVQRHDAPNAIMQPSFGEAFASPLDNFDDAQEDDLDWGDGREVQVTWRPNAGPMFVTAGARYGKTNGQSKRYVEDNVGGYCVFNEPLAYLCPYYVSQRPAYADALYVSADNHADARAFDREEHSLVDFAVGRDFGMGGLSRSSVSAGLRFARFESLTNAELKGVPDWYIPPGVYYPGYTITHTTYLGRLQAKREFEGTGAALTWDAAFPLLKMEEMGQVEVEWSLSGGALLGDRETVISSHEEERDYITNPLALGGVSPNAPTAIQTTITDPDPFSRSSSATVPFGGARLGLSYNVGAFKASAGYRWERYFDVLDGGFSDEEDADRTIDGPYFKIAVGFGG